METADSAPPAKIFRVVVRLSPFWAERPAVWFIHAEAQFPLAGISSEKTKFCYVISQLDHPYAKEVEDIINSPSERDCYITLRTELVRRLSPSRKQRILQLLTLEMGDRKRLQFLRHLRSVTPRRARRLLPQHLVRPATRRRLRNLLFSVGLVSGFGISSDPAMNLR
jgi:hypothetical protein